MLKANPCQEHRTRIAFKAKREHIAKLYVPNIACPRQHIDMEIPHGLRNHVIEPDTVKTTFNLNINSTGTTHAKVLGKKKLLLLESKKTDTINSPDIYETCKDFYLARTESREKLVQGI